MGLIYISQDDLQIAVSTAKDAAVNTPEDNDGSNYEGLLVEPVTLMLPEPEIENDKNMVGDGAPWTRNTWLGYWQNEGLTLKSLMNIVHTPKFLAAAQQGPVDETEVEAGLVYDLVFPMSLSKIPDLLTFVIGAKGSPWKYKFGSNAIASYKISHQSGETPTDEFVFVGTGHFDDIKDADPAFVFPAPVDYEYFSKYGIEVLFNNGAAQNLTSAARYIGYEFGMDYATAPRKRGGDPPRISGDYSSGGFARQLRRQIGQPTLSLTLEHDDQLSEWQDLVDRKVWSGLSIKHIGPKIPTAATSNYEIEFTFPNNKIVGVKPDFADKDSQLTVNLDPGEDPVTGGCVIARIRTDRQDLFA